MLEGNRKEVIRLNEELRVSRDSFNGLRNESFRVKNHNKDLSKDLACYTQLCEMLSSELLSARLEIQRQRYDMRHEAATPDTYKVPQVEAKPAAYTETLMKVAGIKK